MTRVFDKKNQIFNYPPKVIFALNMREYDQNIISSYVIVSHACVFR